MPTPNVVRFDEKLNAVSPAAANDVWAVGSTNRSLVEHWNGSAWTIVPTPDPVAPAGTTLGTTLTAVSALSANDIWAVGNTIDTVSGSFLPDKPIAMHWNGVSWALAPLPNVGTGAMTSVTASSSANVWAAGPGASIVHWNGTSWGPDSTPDSTALLRGISAVPGSATEVWAAGIILPAGGPVT